MLSYPSQAADLAAIKQLRPELEPCDRDMPPEKVYFLLPLLTSLYHALKRESGDAATHLALAIGKHATHNRWRYIANSIRNRQMMEDVAELVTAYEFHVNQPKRVSTRNYVKPAEGVERTLAELFDVMVLLNPAFMSLRGMMNVMRGLKEDTREPNDDLPVGPYQFRTRAYNSINAKRSQVQLEARRSSFYLPVYTYNPATNEFVPPAHRQGAFRLPPLDPVYGLEFYQMGLCSPEMRASPFYRFHAHAWALRGYAAALDRAGFDECPFLGWGDLAYNKLDIWRLRMHQEPDPTNSMRYLVEAAWYFEKQTISHFKSGERRRKLTGRSRGANLTFYLDLMEGDRHVGYLQTSPTQALPDHVLDMIPVDQRATILAREAMGSFHKVSSAVPCTMAEYELLLNHECRRFNLLRWQDVPRIPITRGSKLDQPLRIPSVAEFERGDAATPIPTDVDDILAALDRQENYSAGQEDEPTPMIPRRRP